VVVAVNTPFDIVPRDIVAVPDTVFIVKAHTSSTCPVL
jgi:hypothetical protein